MFFATLIALALAVAIYGTVLVRMTSREDLVPVVICFASTLPMCWVAYYFIRLPADKLLEAALTGSPVLPWIRTAYAPLTEEPSKLWILLVPFLRNRLNTFNIASFALALGLGFAMGEMITVASIVISHKPDLASTPWYLLSGFISERLMVCAIHSGMTASALAVWIYAPRLGLGLLLAMCIHYCLNLPIFLSGLSLFRAHPEITQFVLSLWVLAAFVGAIAFLRWLSGGVSSFGELLYGRALCPSCKSVYNRSLWTGLNFGNSLRYERCPSCKSWHWTNRLSPESGQATSLAQ
jgi:hypothetical protein